MIPVFLVIYQKLSYLFTADPGDLFDAVWVLGLRIHEPDIDESHDGRVVESESFRQAVRRVAERFLIEIDIF